jgi:hypothetical protein
MNQTCMSKCAFTLGTHFGEDMAFVSVLSLDLSGAGVRESLLGTGIGFHFWHCGDILIVDLL